MFQKYSDALNLMDATIAVSDDSEKLHKAWDDLYTFVYEHFVCPITALAEGETLATTEHKEEFEAEVEEMVVMFSKNRETMEEELRKIPPVIAEVAFPVYIARHLLRFYNLSVYPSKLSTFALFHKRYAYMVINGSGRRPNVKG